MKNLLFVFIFFSTPLTFAWTIDADFEGGVVGERPLAQGPYRFAAMSKTVFSTEQVHRGAFAVKATILKGSDGFGDFGGNFTFPNKLKEGDEVWYRTWIYAPDTFSFWCGGCTEGPKFMRIHTETESGNSDGYWNYHFLTNGVTIATSVTDEFYDNHPFPRDDIRGLGEPMIKNSWHAYEQNIKFSSTGGQGHYRAWRDGELIFEDEITPTLGSATSRVDLAQLFTYWRGDPTKNPKKDQSLYIDDVLITNETPKNKDANGYPFVGLGDGESMGNSNNNTNGTNNQSAGTSAASTNNNTTNTPTGQSVVPLEPTTTGSNNATSMGSKGTTTSTASEGCSTGSNPSVPWLVILGMFFGIRRRKRL